MAIAFLSYTMPAGTECASEVGPNRVEQVAWAIREHIQKSRLVVGDQLPSEGDFCDALKVSRTVVREAFRALEALNLIEVSTGRRPRVGKIASTPNALLLEHGLSTAQLTTLQIYDVRRTMEIRLAGLAATLHSDGQAQEMEDCACRMHEQFLDGDITAAMESDIAMHLLIAQACGNPLFILLLDSMMGVVRQTWPKGWKSCRNDDERTRQITVHLVMSQAILSGDPQRAAQAMAQHFDQCTQSLLLAGLS